jgi:quinol-cytochrome oxidoreductase complex cytochrome b subunit
VGTATLERFYTIHFCMPFIIFMASYVHFALLHEYGSTNPLGLSVATDEIPFVPYYGIKDLLSVTFVLAIFFFFVFFYPLVLGHSDNLMKQIFWLLLPI